MSDAHTVWSVVRYNEYTSSRDTLLLGSTLCLADGARLCLAATFGEEGEASIASLTAAADLGERVSMVASRRGRRRAAGGRRVAVARRGSRRRRRRELGTPGAAVQPAARAYLCAATDDATGAPTFSSRTPEAAEAKRELRRAPETLRPSKSARRWCYAATTTTTTTISTTTTTTTTISTTTTTTTPPPPQVLLVNSGGATVIARRRRRGGAGAAAAWCPRRKDLRSTAPSRCCLRARAHARPRLRRRRPRRALFAPPRRCPSACAAYAVGVDADADAVLSRQLHDRGRLTASRLAASRPRRRGGRRRRRGGGGCSEPLLQQLARYCKDAMAGADDDEVAAATVAAAVAGAATGRRRRGGSGCFVSFRLVSSYSFSRASRRRRGAASPPRCRRRRAPPPARTAWSGAQPSRTHRTHHLPLYRCAPPPVVLKRAVLACRQRPENELYLSKWPALVEHLPLNVGAEEALTEILSDNRQPGSNSRSPRSPHRGRRTTTPVSLPLPLPSLHRSTAGCLPSSRISSSSRASVPPTSFLKASPPATASPSTATKSPSACPVRRTVRRASLRQPAHRPTPPPPHPAPPSTGRRPADGTEGRPRRGRRHRPAERRGRRRSSTRRRRRRAAPTPSTAVCSPSHPKAKASVSTTKIVCSTLKGMWASRTGALRAATAVPLRGLPRVLVKWEGVENATPKSLYATEWVPLGLVSAAADPGIPQPPPKPSPRGGRTRRRPWRRSARTRRPLSRRRATVGGSSPNISRRRSSSPRRCVVATTSALLSSR